MLTYKNFAKAIVAYLIFFLWSPYSFGQCAPGISHPSTKLVLSYNAGEVPDNLEKIDVAFPELTKENIGVVPVGNSWQTESGTDFTGVTLTGEVTIYYMDNSSEICEYTDGSLNGQLPVELTVFTGFLDKNDVLLSWSTLSEFQNAGFEIERSFDGERFENIGSIAGAGSTTQKQDYTFTDLDVKNHALGTIAYYRLKQIDYDGKNSYSQVIPVDLQIEVQGFAITKITGWNSPEKRLQVYFNNPAQVQKIQLLVSDISGTIVKNEVFYPAPGFQFIELDLSDLKDQLYFLSMNNGRSLIAKKIFLQTL